MVTTNADLADLRPHPRNYNRHGEAQVLRLMESLRRFGQPKPIVIWQGLIIAGHGLVMAAQRLGMQSLLATDMSEAWTETEALAFMAADNELARLGDPDNEALARLAAEIGDVDAQLAALAAGTEERLKELITEMKRGQGGDDPGPQVDKAAELAAKWGTATGQLWQLGEHRLICGDCTDAAVVERVMGGERATIMFTDPPYNHASNDGLIATGISASFRDLKKAEWDFDFDLLAALDVLLQFLDSDLAVYVFASHHTAPIVWDWMKSWADHYSLCIWEKVDVTPSLSRRHCTWNSELLPYATRGRHVFNFSSHDTTLSVWRFQRVNSFGYLRDDGTQNRSNDFQAHPTQKPLELVIHAVEHSSNPGDVVLDPFLGSGTTLIACERLGRRCRAVEIEPGYVAVALERWATMTGQAPVLLEG